MPLSHNMNKQIDTAEYEKLCISLEELHKKFIIKRQEVRDLLVKTAALQRDALLVLSKAVSFTKHLTGRQRQAAGLSNQFLVEINVRIKQITPLLIKDPNGAEGELSSLIINTGFPAETLAGNPAGSPAGSQNQSRRELSQKVLLLLGMIDRVRKNLLQLDILEQRCRELILSINKALEAFRHEYRIIRRKIYPYGVFSQIGRSLRPLLGGTYFSFGDLDDIGDLCNITNLVLKIADSKII